MGRVDAAVSLSQEPRPVPDDLKSSWERARVLPKDRMRQLAVAVWGGTAIGVTAAAMMLGACLKLGCFQAVSSVTAGSHPFGLRVELEVAAKQTNDVV